MKGVILNLKGIKLKLENEDGFLSLSEVGNEVETKKEVGVKKTKIEDKDLDFGVFEGERLVSFIDENGKKKYKKTPAYSEFCNKVARLKRQAIKKKTGNKSRSEIARKMWADRKKNEELLKPVDKYDGLVKLNQLDTPNSTANIVS